MKEATIDHIIPLSKGGRDDITNMQLAHDDCNQLKADKMPEGENYDSSESINQTI